MGKSILKNGHMSQAGRLFVPTVKRHTPLFAVGSIDMSKYDEHKIITDVSGLDWLYAYSGKGVWKRLFQVI